MAEPAPSLSTPGLIGLESHLLERVDAAVMAVDLEGRILFVNRYAEELYGRPREESIGRLSHELANVSVDPDVASEIMQALREGRSWEGTFEVLRKDGTKITVRTVDSPLYDASGTVAGVVSVAIDATQESLKNFLSEVAVVLGTTLEFERNLSAFAQLLVPRVGDICLIDATDGDRVVRLAAVHADARKQPLLDELAASYPPDPHGPHPAAYALRTGESVYLAEIDRDTREALARDERHRELIDALDFRSYACVPLRAHGRTLGAVTMISCTDDRRYGPDDITLLQAVAERAAMALDNARLFDDQQRARSDAESAAERLEQLQTLSTALARAVSVLEVTKVIGAIQMSQLGSDNRGLWLVDEANASLELVQGFELRGFASRYASIPLDSDLPAAEIVRTRAPIFVRSSREREERFPGFATENEGACFAALPLIAEERTLGVLAFGFEPDRSFDDNELRFLSAIADQCAQALARAILYDRERLERTRAERDRRRIQELNRALQTSLLPPALPHIPGVELEARYHPALSGLEVGGDFYDVFDTGGDWAIVIGDVCGKGPEAAAVTAVARWTIRSVAIDMRQPAQVLRKVNDSLVHQHLDDRFCTIAYARVVPSAQGVRVSVCRGGHPAPLVLRTSGAVEGIGTAGSLIGILPDVRLWEETTHLQSGDAIVFYTDGVTEARRGREQFGEERLVETLLAHQGSDAAKLIEAIETDVLDFTGGEATDDIALVVLRVR